ncbi:hypothetical protein [Streptomyces sp. NPDC005017]|uniref:hypothetical protein n=1 Tax=Streptomyces sp. NPDC005017 TaxID=3364706 RepID=UPI0036A547C9
MTGTDDRMPEPEDRTPASEEAEYSATVLASHWIQRPDDEEEGAAGSTRRETADPAGVGGPTLREPVAGPAEPTVRETGSGLFEPTRRESPADPFEPTVREPGAGVAEPTRRVTGAGPLEPTRRDGGAGPAAPAWPEAAGEYPDEPTRRAHPSGPAPPDGPGETAPDRVEGTLLRFGPGVTAAVAQRTQRPLPVVPAPRVPLRRRLRRHTLPAVVFLCVLAFLAWQRLGAPIEVRTVTVTTSPSALECGGTTDVFARVSTNGRPGTLTYRWVRSDGTSSAVLRERLARGQRHANLHLRWTFEGEGRHQGRAELRILSPSGRTATARVTYDCP